LAANVLD